MKASVGAFFTRVQPERLQDNALRQQVMQAIRTEPGIHFKALARTTGVSPSTLRHHLRKLEEGGIVTVRRLGGYSCHFAGNPTGREVTRAPATRASGAQDVMRAIRAQPGRTGRELAEVCGLQPSTVHYHVAKLVAAGLIEAARDGRVIRLHPKPA